MTLCKNKAHDKSIVAVMGNIQQKCFVVSLPMPLQLVSSLGPTQIFQCRKVAGADAWYSESRVQCIGCLADVTMRPIPTHIQLDSYLQALLLLS